VALMLMFGNTPVPYTVSWSGEDRIFLERCPHAGGSLAICQEVRPGVGKPKFGAPHMNRQREAVVRGLCDLCGKPLKTRTKVSLSHARSRTHAAEPLDVLQVEPLLHRECALISASYCPSLKRDIRNGTVEIRQVTQWRAQLAIYSEQGVFEVCGERRKAICLAKVQLLKWIDRDAAWLGLSVDDQA